MYRLLRWLSVVGVSVLFLLFPRLAMAQVVASQGSASCNYGVLDTTTAHVLDKYEGPITRALERLETIGVDVRVRAFQTAPDGSLDAYESAQVSSCPSWRGPDGAIKDNLVVFAVSLDHQSAIYYGGNLSVLASSVDSIRANDMDNQFKLGHFSAGIINAITAVYGDLSSSALPVGNSGTGNSTSNRSTAPIGLVFLWVVLGILMVLAIAFIDIRVHRSRRRRLENVKAKSEAVTMHDRALSTLGGITNSDDTKTTVTLILNQLVGDDHLRVSTAWQNAEMLVAQAFAANIPLSDNPAANDPNLARTTEEYQAIMASYQELNRLAFGASAALSTVDKLCTNLQTAMDEAPATLQTMQAQLATTTQAYQQLKADGFLFSADAELNKATQAITDAITLIGSHHNGMAIVELVKVQLLCSDVTDRMEVLRQRKKDLEERYDHLSGTTAFVTGQEKNSIIDLLGDLTAHFDASCLTGLPSAAQITHQYTTADKALDEAATALHTNPPDWDRAATLLDDAERCLKRYAEMSGKVSDRGSQLAKLESSTPSDIDSVTTTITFLKAATANRRGNQSGHAQNADDLGRRLSFVRSELNDHDKPEYLAISNQLEDIRKAASGIDVASKQEEHRTLNQEARARREANLRAQALQDSSYDNGLGNLLLDEVIIDDEFGGGVDTGGGDPGSSSGDWGSDPGSSSGGW